MARRQVVAIVRIQIPAGQATPAPPVGTALGPHGVAIMEFCKQYNAATESQRGVIVPAEITVYNDRTFTFITKTPPVPVLLRMAAGIDKGSATPNKIKVGKVTDDQVKTYIGYLRRKIGDEAVDSQLIETVRGFGYRYRRQTV